MFRLGSHTPGAGSAKSHRNHNSPLQMVVWRPQIDLLLPSWSGLVIERQLLVGRFSRELLVAQMVKCLSTMRETWVQSLGQEDLLEKEMATHSSILAWKTPWMVEPGRLQSIGLQSWTRLSNFTFTCNSKDTRGLWTIAGSRGPRHRFSLFLSACFWIGLTMYFGISQKLTVCTHTVSLLQVHESPFFHNQLNRTLFTEVLGNLPEPASVNMLFKTLTATILPICSPSQSSHVSYLISVSSVSSTMPGIGLIVKQCLLNE